MNNEEKEEDWFKKWLPKQPDKKKTLFFAQVHLTLRQPWHCAYVSESISAIK